MLLKDPHFIVWMRKSLSKLVVEVVGHVPREISRVIFFLIHHESSVKGELNCKNSFRYVIEFCAEKLNLKFIFNYLMYFLSYRPFQFRTDTFSEHDRMPVSSPE